MAGCRACPALVAADSVCWPGDRTGDVVDSENVIALAGVLVAVLALAVSIVAARYSRSSTNVAKEAADAAHRSAEQAEAMVRLEKERWHKDLAPEPPDQIEAEKVDNPATGDASLFGEIKVPHAYRVKATARAGNSSRDISLPLLLLGGRSYPFEIEKWPPGQTRLQTDEVRFQFWPPVAEVDDTDPWACSCDRPAAEQPGGSGHWEWRVPVVYTDATDSIW